MSVIKITVPSDSADGDESVEYPVAAGARVRWRCRCCRSRWSASWPIRSRAARSKSASASTSRRLAVADRREARAAAARSAVRTCAVWSQLGFIHDDTVTGDADGRILQFLQEAKRNTDLAQEFWVANAAGTGHRVDAAGAARPRSRRPRVAAGRAPRRSVGRPSGDAGSDRPRRHAARVSAAGELRSVQAGRRARGSARLAEDRRHSSERQGACRKGRTSAATSCWPSSAGRDSWRAAVSRRLGAGQDAPQQPRPRRYRHRSSTATGRQRHARRARCDLPRRIRDDRAARPYLPDAVAHGAADAHRRGVCAAWQPAVDDHRAVDRAGRAGGRGLAVYWATQFSRPIMSLVPFLQVGGRRRSLEGISRQAPATSSACSPRRPTTWPASCAA